MVISDNPKTYRHLRRLVMVQPRLILMLISYDGMKQFQPLLRGDKVWVNHYPSSKPTTDTARVNYILRLNV